MEINAHTSESFNARADGCIRLAIAWCGLGSDKKEVNETESAAMVQRSPPATARGLTDKLRHMADLVRLTDEYVESRKRKSA